MRARRRGTATTSRRRPPAPAAAPAAHGKDRRIPAAILGATGTVGQRFLELLAAHPWFRVVEVMASDQSAGKPYEVAVGSRWKLSSPIPDAARRLKVKKPGDRLSARILFSSLDASVAGEVETHYARAGHMVSSNARNHRMDPLVPLVIPEVNRDHLEMLDRQKHPKGGGIVTNPNCSAIALALAVAPLHRQFGIEALIVTTFQAVSGAGYPGVPSLDILGNIVPHIGGGEEAKVESETLKILGRLGKGGFEPAPFPLSAAIHRVPVVDGHHLAISLRFRARATRKQIAAAIAAFRPLARLGLPSAPAEPLLLRTEEDRPQPRLDVDRAGGMGVTLGRLRPCAVLDWKFEALGHNTIRGAAGAAILNAEILARDGRI